MEILQKKSIVYRLVIVLIFLTLFNFAYPNISYAAEQNILLAPIMEFLTKIGDSTMWFLQKNVLGMEETFYILDKTSIWGKVGKFALIGLGTVGAIVLTGGIALGAGALLGTAASALAAHGIAVALPAVNITVGGLITSGVVGGFAGYSLGKKVWLNSRVVLPMFYFTPEEMFLNRIAMLDVNFINPNKYDNIYLQNSLGQFISKSGGEPIEADENGNPVNPDDAIPITDVKISDETGYQTSIAYNLSKTIAKWYVALRNLAIVMLLCILVYIGIKIIISSSNKDKAKYKQMLFDWIVAMCLLFVLHYIMSFALYMTESLNKLFQQKSSTYLIELPNLKDYNLKSNTQDSKAESSIEDALTNEEGFIWPTNLMGKLRLEMQLAEEDNEADYSQIGYTIAYLVLVIYTVMFAFIYIKRVIYMAFLTLISPMVVMTYPLDKMSDGKAQAFNMWLKEYIFTLLIQPVHALLYTIFISMAIDFARTNVVYCLVCIGFILQAEKIIRKLFGFEKANAFSIMNSSLGGAMMMQGINMLGRKGGKKSQGSSQSTSNIRTKGNEVDSRGDSNNTDPVRAFTNPTETLTAPSNNTTENTDIAGMANEDVYNGYLDYQMGNYDLAAETQTSSSTITNDSSVVGEDNSNNLSPAAGRKIKGYAKVAGKRLLGQTISAGMNFASGAYTTATKLPLAATLGTLGIAAGLASDNSANIAKYGATAAGVGYALSGSKNINVNEIKEDSLREIYGKDYEEYKNRQSDKAFMADKQTIDYYIQKYGSEQYKQKMQSALKYRQNGIVDNKLISKSMKAPGNFGNEISEKRIALAKLASQVSSSKDINNLGIRLRTKGVSETDANEITEALRYIKGIV